MNEYTPEKLVKISRYQNYFPTLPEEIRSDTYARMRELLEEEKKYCDKGNYKHNESDPIPARTEVGRVALPEGADLKTFRDARSLKGGVLFARKLTSGTLVPDWEGLYINDSGEIGGLEDYVLREVGENAWYLGSVPQGLE